MQNIHFYSPKGGTGTSTTVATMASMLSNWGQKVLIVEHSGSACEIDAILSVPKKDDEMIQEVNQNIHLSFNYSPATHYGYDFALFDHGHKIPKKGFPVAPGDRTIAVLRNDYMSLKAMMTLDLADEESIFILHPEGVLSIHDVSTVMRGPVLATIPFSPAIARANDAGMIMVRSDRKEHDNLRDLCYKMAQEKKETV